MACFLHPALHHPVALVGLYVPVIIVAAAPETIEELRVRLEPPGHAKVRIVEAELSVSLNVGDVCVYRKTRVGGESSTCCHKQKIRAR